VSTQPSSTSLRTAKQAIYNSGREAAEKFLETWNYAGYLAEFRSGKDQSRRDDIAAEMEKAVHA
jgi:hypothetical protein